MKLTIKTTLVTIEIEDEPTMSNGYTRRSVNDVNTILTTAIEDAIKLHTEIKLLK